MRALLSLAATVALVVFFQEVSLQVSRAQSESAPRKLAFLVGVKTYNHSQLKTLDYPERDVEQLAPVLRRSGYTVVLLTTAEGLKTPALIPTAANIQAQLEKLLASVTRQDMILVGLAGHGIQPLGSDSAYFCPKDANPTIVAGMANSPSRPRFPATLLGIDDLLQTLDESGIGRKLVLMDACRNDPGVRGRRGVDRVKVSALPQETGVLLSCSPGQYAFEHKNFGGGHGAFFHHVIEAFNGHAIDDQENGVTWESLVKYVGKRVPASVKLQYGAEGGEQRPNLIANLPVEAVLLAKRPRLLPLSAVMQGAQAAFAGRYEGEEWSGNGLAMKFRWCPPGKFTMGSPQDEPERQGDEDQVAVTLTEGFWLGTHEVTQGEWQRVMGTTLAEQRDKVDVQFNRKASTPLRGEGDVFPMYFVRHSEAVEFCEKLTKQEQAAMRLAVGWSYRLPTEAQWEYACRAGTQTATAFGNSLSDVQAHFSGMSPYNGAAIGRHEESTVRVASFKSNAWGLCDMHGNVWELCDDWYTETLPGGDDPLVSVPGQQRIVRGGGWRFGGAYCRSASRESTAPTLRDDDLGFRVALVRSKL